MSEPITRTVRVKKLDDGFWQGDILCALSRCVGSAAGQSCKSIFPPPEVQSGTVTITFTPDPPDPPKIPWPWPDVNRVRISGVAITGSRYVNVSNGKTTFPFDSIGCDQIGVWHANEPRIAVNDNGFVRLEKCN